jgi:hypothetical protein
MNEHHVKPAPPPTLAPTPRSEHEHDIKQLILALSCVCNDIRGLIETERDNGTLTHNQVIVMQAKFERKARLVFAMTEKLCRTPFAKHKMTGLHP